MRTEPPLAFQGKTFCPWYVAHTRPRREKKLAEFCRRQELFVSLPCVTSVRVYGRKRVEFAKPLFPGYIFFRSSPEFVHTVYQNQHAANVLEVYDQSTFERQLEDILSAVQSRSVIAVMHGLAVGRRARIRSGPLAGLAGNVVRMSDPAMISLRLDFIAQGAILVVAISELELID
jgi:transcriptional antiterminator RfaH